MNIEDKSSKIEEDDKPNKKRKQKSQGQKSKLVNVKWLLTITVASFFISMSFSYFSSEALANVNNTLAFVILLCFIFLGIVFDVIGVAATSGSEKQFHSMAAKRVAGAKEAVWLIHNAEKVASFCNDVVGDISGIISGATGAIIIARIATSGSIFYTVVQLVITGMIAALTIGGKAAGKTFGISHSEKILFTVGKMIHILPVKIDRKKQV